MRLLRFVVITLPIALPVSVRGQPLAGAMNGSLSMVSTATTDSSGRAMAKGLLAGIEGRVGVGRLSLVASYAEGQVGASAHRALAEGSAAIAVAIGPAFELRAGPVARAVVGDSGGTRWLQWRAMGRYSAEIAPGRSFAYAEGWAATGTRSGVGGVQVAASGGAVGVGWRRDQLGVRLEYGVDESRLGIRERFAVERLTVLVDLAGRR